MPLHHSFVLVIAFVGLLSCKSEAKSSSGLTEVTVTQGEIAIDQIAESKTVEEEAVSQEIEISDIEIIKTPEEEEIKKNIEDENVKAFNPILQEPIPETIDQSIAEKPSSIDEVLTENAIPTVVEDIQEVNSTTTVSKENITSIITLNEESNTEGEEVGQAKDQEVDLHDIWNNLLNKYVSKSGVVNYQGMKSEEALLDTYLDKLAANVPAEKSDQAMAYWINAYNAFTVKLILNNYPTKSIRDVHDGNPWDVKWIELGGKTYSLNQIEHEILRPTYKDPRIHFAVNCAAHSCPKISNVAFTQYNLEYLLKTLTKSFVNNHNANTLSAETLQLSKIFEWYKDDFGDLTSFIIKYADEKVSPSASVSFKDYDWSLNGK